MLKLKVWLNICNIYRSLEGGVGGIEGEIEGGIVERIVRDIVEGRSSRYNKKNKRRYNISYCIILTISLSDILLNTRRPSVAIALHRLIYRISVR